MTSHSLSVLGDAANGSLVAPNLDDLPLTGGLLTRNLTVRKANDIATAQISLSTWSFRVLEAAQALYNRNSGSAVVSFHLKDLLKVFDSKSNRPYEFAEQIASDLMGNFIKVEHTSMNNRSKFEVQSLVDKCTYDSGLFTVKFSDDGLDLLNEDRNFTSYPYLAGNKHDSLKNAFFHIIAANAYTGEYSDHLDIFRQRLNIPDNKWNMYGHMKSRAIIPAIKAVNDSGLFTVALAKEEKLGRKVIGLRFSIVDHRKYSSVLPPMGETSQQEMDIECSDDAIIQMLRMGEYVSGTHDVRTVKMVKSQAAKAGVSVTNYIQSALDYRNRAISRAAERGESKDFSGGYIVKALQDDYGRRDREKRQKELEILQLEALNKQADNDFRKLKDDHGLLFSDLPAMLSQVTPKQKDALLTKVKENLSIFGSWKKLLKSISSLEDERFLSDPAASAIVKEHVKELLQDKKPGSYPDLKAFAESRNVSLLVMERVDNG